MWFATYMIGTRIDVPKYRAARLSYCWPRNNSASMFRKSSSGSVSLFCRRSSHLVSALFSCSISKNSFALMCSVNPKGLFYC